MSYTELGRNDPCKCGSGKKYKHCCIGRDDGPSPPGPGEEIFAEMRRELQGRNFATIEEANAFIADCMQRRNSRSLDEFCGLSPEQMRQFLWFPFDSPDLVTFPLNLDPLPSAPILPLFQAIADAIGDKGMKPTATGNLPRKLVQETALNYPGDKWLSMLLERGSLRSEDDFPDLHTTRVVAELAGLIRKYKGRFILGRDCRKIMAGTGPAGVYPLLLATYAWKFNWAYRDGCPKLNVIQESFLFTLYLLHRFGAEWRTNTFYEDAFLRAFPAVLDEVEPRTYSTPENRVRSCYSTRCLEHFAVFLGLADLKPETYQDYPHGFELRKTPLLDQAVKFSI